MSWIVVAGVALQVLSLWIFIRKLGRRCPGNIGFVLIFTTFIFHGLTEIAQAQFPNLDRYRESIDGSSLDYFVALMSFGMLLFTLCYFMRPPVLLKGPEKLNVMIGSLRSSYLLKWQVLLAIGIPAYIMIGLRDQTQNLNNYWSGGLSDQFTPIVLILAFTTACIRMRGRQLVAVACAFVVLLIAAGSRTLVVLGMGTSLSVLTRYGVRISAKTALACGLAIGLCFAILSTTRNTYGRFNSGEGFVDRLDTMAASARQTTPGGDSRDQVLEDTVYRFDGNSYGALILQKQLEGYPITGVTQLMSTVGYMIPSFLYPQKLNLDLRLRNEEGYATDFYQLDDNTDYISDLWSLLTGYCGGLGLLACFVFLGFAVARLDKWLDTQSSAPSYIWSICGSLTALSIEQGLAGVIYFARAFTVLVAVEWIASLLSRGQNRQEGFPSADRDVRAIA